MKMLLVADGQLELANTAGEALASVAARARAGSAIQTLAEMQERLTAHGFLLLNASLVFRPHVPPVKDAKAWLPFFETVMKGLAERQPTLVLWGKIAEQLNKLPVVKALPQIVCEHPYNISFIANKEMHALFGPMRLLKA
jgi:uracil-DNA glycosylase